MKTTTITVAPFTINEIPFWPITVAKTGGNAYLSPMQSIAPPTFGLTLPQSEATFPIIVISFDNSHVVTVVPQPTATSINPPGTSIPILTYSDGEAPSNGGCSSGGDTTGCRKIDCSLFGFGNKCEFFGCDGGCRLGFCRGSCGPLDCGPGCGPGKSTVFNNQAPIS